MKLRLQHLIFILISMLLAACDSSSQAKKIGIIVPLSHKAMDEITDGFTQTLKTDYHGPLRFKIANAQGDLNLQRAIVMQMKAEKYDLIVPIGTTTTEMTAAAISAEPIVSLAALYSEQDRKNKKPCNIAVVHDEISVQQLIDFIHLAYPKLSQLTLIHSASEKVFPEVEQAKMIGKKLGIEIKPIMVPTLNELYGVANALPQNTQGILVLKDSLIVSGISTLAMSAAKNHIPLITADQGSVQDGAAFALGVHERDIGVLGAKLATAVLDGKPACNLPITEMTDLTVFINRTSLTKENQSLPAIQLAAEKMRYKLEVVK